ncbi:MAG: 50S ribosomal protein L9 [Actinomycetota bacterium]
MRVILQREVENLGAPGDVVAVADGYARNYLMPRGLAIPASKGAVRHAERLRQAHEQHVGRALDEARAVAERLTSRPLRIPTRVGADGRLFGSITVADLADEIQKVSGQEIDRRRIHVAEPIRSVGTHEVVVHLHPQINAAVTVEVVPE